MRANYKQSLLHTERCHLTVDIISYLGDMTYVDYTTAWQTDMSYQVQEVVGFEHAKSEQLSRLICPVSKSLQKSKYLRLQW